MRGEWQTAPLSELTDVATPITYGVVKPGPTDSEGVLFVRGGDIAGGRVLVNQLRTITREVSDQYRRTQLCGGEIIVSLVGNPGEVALVPDSLRGANIARQVGLVHLREDVSSLFIKYFLGSGLGQVALGAHLRGSVQQVINLRDLKTVVVPVPPLSEQRAIAHILGTLDDKIELNRRMSETLETMARALFKSWFVDFAPVRAKAEGQDPGLPQPLADLFPVRLVNSELGEIPEGWDAKQVSVLAEVVGGTTPRTSEPEFWENGIHHWVTPKDLSALRMPVLLETQRRITDLGLAQIGSGLLPVGSVLLSSRAPIGYLAISQIPVAINQGFIAMKPREGISSFFLLLWAFFAHEEILGRANGSTFLEISKTNFRPIPVAAPTDLVMKTFDRVVQPMYERIAANERESRKLETVRDALLPKLMSGEIRVTDAERFVHAAAAP